GKEGTGRSPTATDTVLTHYRGRLLDGTLFDSTYRRGRPETFKVAGVIKGWTEVLQLMKEGASWEVWIPSELAYGSRGQRPFIDGYAVLVFELELRDPGLNLLNIDLDLEVTELALGNVDRARVRAGILQDVEPHRMGPP
ncbi:MAG: FKBP-type peptidyl-prolyl cis-trans isomerase, partial [Acidobacteria bacterium]|nr:FKBP-type peptidyl-prolyl cis-trans isomerase [Acidobacteriota bacterium]